jgi:hypothetical protein
LEDAIASESPPRSARTSVTHLQRCVAAGVETQLPALQETLESVGFDVASGELEAVGRFRPSFR